MQMLGVNTIRVYNLDPTLNHDECVSIFNSVGIYLVLDVNSPLPNESLNPGDLSSSYTSDYLNRVFQVIEAFHNFPNILGFFSGNEVMNDPGDGEKVPPYIRAVTRDMNHYISKHSPRLIPVGYSAADVKEILTDSWAYLSCAIDGKQDDPSRIEFFGLNSYSWCGPTSATANYEASSYDELIEQFGSTSIPIFFSEYGCNKVEPRVWDEVAVIYGNMTSVMSGGLVYEYYQEESNNYGLVNIYDNETAEVRVDFDNLQKAYGKLDFKTIQSQNSSGTSVKAPSCGKNLISSDSFSSDFKLPDLPDGAQELIDNGAKNAKEGKLVDIKQTKVALPVYASNGKEMQNLAIKPLANDQSNTPSSTTGGPGPSTSKKGSGSHVEASWTSMLAQLGAVVLSLMFA